MDTNTILELEALKMEARAIEISVATSYDKFTALMNLIPRIRALKQKDLTPYPITLAVEKEARNG